jgi:CheY-specific phosphatase CheX
MMISSELSMPFITATSDFLTMELGIPATQAPVTESGKQGTSQELNILVGITGMINGQVIYSMSAGTAKNIAAIMLGRSVQPLDRNAQSALCELGNMITGMATSRFDVRYTEVALTPPSLIAGNNIFISVLKMGYIYTSFATEIGNIDVTIAARENTMLKQADAV